MKPPFRKIDGRPPIQHEPPAFAPLRQEAPHLPHRVPPVVDYVQRDLRPFRADDQNRLKVQRQAFAQQLIAQ